MQEEFNSVVATKAPVAPRARRTDSQVPLRLDQLVLPYIQCNARGVIYIIAPAGAGKTTAINHLRATLPTDANIAYFDDPQFDHWTSVVQQKLVVLTTTRFLSIAPLDRFELATWSEDDCFEYLATTHRAQCASVLKRLKDDPLTPMLDGSPMHLRAVMDEMAGDEALVTVGEGLRRRARRLIPDANVHANVLIQAASGLGKNHARSIEFFTAQGLSTSAVRFCGQRGVVIALGAQWVAESLAGGKSPQPLQSTFSREVIAEIAVAVRSRPAAKEMLDQIMNRSTTWGIAMTASIQLAVDPAWRPKKSRGIDLSGAILAGARWNGLDLKGSTLRMADLIRADLSDATLTKVSAWGVNLAGVNLQRAQMELAQLKNSVLIGADLTGANASGAYFDEGQLHSTILVAAWLAGAVLRSAELKDSDFTRADLTRADLSRATVHGARFIDAQLCEAHLEHVAMWQADWTRANFAGARILRCGLEELVLPMANFTGADLTGSILTGTQIPSGQFFGAKLRNTGLADIDWPDADLRDADFTHASFHMGSSRSGLVGSTIPCEGSKTGFYTDDYDEQDFKSPEEIRKANLCGADLRGAKVHKTDWYLVDLRGAQYTPDQAEHFARCGAILHSRVPD